MPYRTPSMFGYVMFHLQLITQHLHPDLPFSSSLAFGTPTICDFSATLSRGCWCWCCSTAAFLASTTRRTINAKVSSTLTFDFALVSINPIPLALAHVSPSAEEMILWL